MSRPVIEYRTTSRETYEDFCLQNPEVSISYQDWKNIIYAFNEAFANYILETGDRIKVPFGLGEVWIGKKKPRRYKVVNGEEKLNLPIDWKKSKELGKVVYHLNLHTDGYSYDWKWDKRGCRIFQKELWNWRPARSICRALSKKLQEPDSDYKYMYRDQAKL
jgi:hypothetical protein